MSQDWYKIENESQIDSPALLIYRERAARNIAQMIARAGSADRLMVHVKTNKMPEVVKMMLQAGISRFKCATLAEAEMVCLAGGHYILIAHQLVGPKIGRLLQLRKLYPQVTIASLLDCREVADDMNRQFGAANMVAEVLLDVNNGMNRSGHPLDGQILALYQYLQTLPNLHCLGLHVYDGHLRDSDFDVRQKAIHKDFKGVEELVAAIEAAGLPRPLLVAGGTPSFSSHVMRQEAYCSPGTCVLWDWGYDQKLKEQHYDFAGLVLTRVISKPAPGIITIDLGHKAVAAENPIDQRVHFLNLQDYELLSQSEEHGVLRVKDWDSLKVGAVLYGVPDHICPTVNLYEEAQVVEGGRVVSSWQVLGRRRRITV